MATFSLAEAHPNSSTCGTPRASERARRRSCAAPSRHRASEIWHVEIRQDVPDGPVRAVSCPSGSGRISDRTGHVPSLRGTATGVRAAVHVRRAAAAADAREERFELPPPTATRDGASGGAGEADGVELLGAGASGDVFGVSSHVSGRRYALKRVARAADVEGALAEAALQKAAGAHPHIERCFHAWTDGGGIAHLLLERCDGGSLWDLLIDGADDGRAASDVRRAGWQPLRAAWGEQLYSALAACHAAGVVHRDVSPFNVLVKLSPSPARLKLADFGLAARVTPAGALAPCAPLGDGAPPSGVCEAAPLDSSALGSVFSAPELGTARYGSAVDVYSAALTLAAAWAALAPSASSDRLDRIITLVERAREACALEAATLDEVLAAALSGALTPAPGSRPSAATLASACAAPAANASAASAAAWPKVLHLLRHGESEYNAHYRDTGGDPGIFDAPLTPAGREQARAVAARIAAEAAPDGVCDDDQYSLHRVQLIVTSPLTRACATCLHALPPPMHSEAAYVVRPEFTEVVEASCDLGSCPDELAMAFPELDFSALQRCWWYNEGGADADDVDGRLKWARGGGFREPLAHATARVDALARWLASRPEACIVLVGHADFFHLLCARHFGRSEWLDNAQVLSLRVSSADVLLTPPSPQPSVGSPASSPTEAGAQLLPGLDASAPKGASGGARARAAMARLRREVAASEPELLPKELSARVLLKWKAMDGPTRAAYIAATP